ncbi:MAG: hypothetical protein P4L36_07575 [Holophaga sp.]|nr:hypothetical protein [Holophaga sp.]
MKVSGTLPSSSSSSSLATVAQDHANPLAVDASTVKSVLLFAADGTYWTSPVSNGSFSVSVDKGVATGMVFAGSSKQFLGYLSLGSGISSLPLTDVATGVTSIDLGSLTAASQVLTPTNNPLGTELPLTAAEQTAYAQCNSLFAGVVQNPDVDGNGVIDLLEGKFYRPFVAYGVNGGHFNGRLTPTVDSSIAIHYFNITLTANGTSDAASATVTGPSGSGITSQACTISTSSTNNQTSYSIYSDLGSSTSAVPEAGSYVYTTGRGATLTITVPDQSDASSHIVIAVPTVTLNTDNTIHSISWAYQTVGGDQITTPSALISGFDLEIDRPIGTRVYNAYNLAASVTSNIITSVSIPWDSKVRIYMAYNDVFLNHYVVTFTND